MKRLSMLIVLVSLMGINAFAQTNQTPRTAAVKANLGLAKPELMGSSSRVLDCDTFINLCPDDTLVLYSVVGGGYVAGQNVYGDIAKADIFYLPGTSLKGCLLYFGYATAANTVDKFNVTAWDNDGTFADASPGAPGTVLATKLVKYSDVVADVTANALTYVAFPSGGPAIPADSIFYVGFEFGYKAGDTIALVTTLDRTGLSCDGIITAVEEWSPDYYGGGWYTYATWGFNGVSNIILPITCKEPCTANITPGSPSICKNKSIELTATGGTTYTWAPSTGLNVTTGAVVIAEPTVSTTYTVSVNGGECSDISIVEVKDAPTSNFTIGACSAGSRLLTRTGTPTTGVKFNWFRDDVKIGGATNATYLATITGNYKVRTTTSKPIVKRFPRINSLPLIANLEMLSHLLLKLTRIHSTSHLQSTCLQVQVNLQT
jgi:hypothetical protein